jgi:hypothetical protein
LKAGNCGRHPGGERFALTALFDVSEVVMELEHSSNVNRKEYGDGDTKSGFLRLYFIFVVQRALIGPGGQ